MARNEIVLGFVGSGKVEKRNAFALLDDFIDANGGNARFIFPLTQAYWNEALEVVSDYAKDKDIPVEAIVDDSTAKTRGLKTYLAGAQRQHSSAAVAHKMASMLAEARKGYLLVLWNDEDEEALDVVKETDAAGVPLLELTRGLDRIELVTNGDEDEDDDSVLNEIEVEAEIVDDSNNQEEEELPEESEFDPVDDDDENEIGEPAAEDDLEAAAEDEEEPVDLDDVEDLQLPEEDDEENVELPEEGETEVSTTAMSEFERRLLTVLERLADRLGAPEAVPAEAPQAPAPARKAAPAKKAAPAAPKATKAAKTAPTKKTVPAKKAGAPAPQTNGKMTREQAQKIIDEYRPRRGRPPAEVTEARKLLGLV